MNIDSNEITNKNKNNSQEYSEDEVKKEKQTNKFSKFEDDACDTKVM